MRLFACQKCGNLLHFENTVCERCGSSLGFLPEAGRLSAFTPDGLAMLDGKPRKACLNVAEDACNWFLPEAEAENFCPACRLNAVVPDLSVAGNLPLWRRMEAAKRRLIYTLDRLRLPHQASALRFSFLADLDGEPPTMTGHEDGHITIALAEADDAEREARRTRLNEPFRTLLGHMRHEVGHWYFIVLVQEAGRTAEFRALFGDESTDYAAALQAHYAKPPNDDWRGNHISAYAAAHPHEDWAECFAHYLHMVDSLEMAASFGLSISPVLDRHGVLETELDFSPYRAGMEAILQAWTPLTIAMNAMNRCMGTPDLYPFVLSAPVARKLGFIHEVVHHRPDTGH
ncbi:zinc-binding metallopeptidase family protein [Falsiroseomonas selenitidurans]|uniref:Zinc-ribbon domain-containing protein n=1 Tax=Falsiroseomonas selenitidurans TaxID=2716335 RepID=A0ABX1E8G6_9PROT|nr:putative zinc-binding metallopeptidase [Falsiroseomonas selenitidurans]NKC33060.1 hypothetical protein [Falsiroseomonas selenitidurans]